MKNIICLFDEQFLPQALDLISRAQRSIYVSTFKAEITTRPRGKLVKKFFDTLIDKSKNGVDVRFLMNDFTGTKSIPHTNSFVSRVFRINKINFRVLNGSRICHAKMIIVDSKIAIVGSHNLSVRSCHNNFEVSLWIDEWEAVQQLRIQYEKIFDSAQKKRL